MLLPLLKASTRFTNFESHPWMNFQFKNEKNIFMQIKKRCLELVSHRAVKNFVRNFHEQV